MAYSVVSPVTCTFIHIIMCIKYVWNGFYQAKLVASCQYEKFLVYFAYIKVYFVQSEKVRLRLKRNVNITKKNAWLL